MPDIIFVNGLSCGDGTQDIFVKDLYSMLGEGIRIYRPNLKKLDRTSTEAAIDGIMEQFKHLQNPIVIGFSLGGLWATFLARKGFTNRVIAISPAVPSNWIQIDLLRLKIFGTSLLFGKSFKFTYEIARDHLMKNVPDEIVRNASSHFMEEPSSLIRDYGFMKGYTKLSEKDVHLLRNNVSGLVITGCDDLMTRAAVQSEFAELLGFDQLIFPCGHTPQLGPHKNLILEHIADFIVKSNRIYPELSTKKAA